MTRPMSNKVWWLRARAFILTFIAYTCFHMTRKVPSIVKSVLHPVSSTGKSSYDEETNPGWAPFNEDLVPYKVAGEGYLISGGKFGVNGHYDCVVDFDKHKPCLRYAKEDGEYELKRIEDNEACEDLRECWVIAKLNSTVYRQLYDGSLPAHAGASEAPDVIHWEEKTEDGFVKDKDVKSKPDTLDGSVLLGTLDSVFLGLYTVGLFASGYVGDRVNIRVFLSVGMFGSAFCMVFLSLAYVWHIHELWYFVLMNAIFGLFQSIGWPSVVAVMGSWFGHGGRGLVMGIWNSHTSVGNILGSVITAAAVGAGMHHEDWPLGYLIPGLIMLFAGALIFVFLIPHPDDVGLIETDIVGLDDDDEEEQFEEDDLHETDGLETPLMVDDDGMDEYNRQSEKPSCGATFRQALQIKGLIPFALSLMFSKMCSYSLLYWGPYYLGNVGFTSEKAGYLCSFFDVGGIFGGIAAGYLSDVLHSRALVAFIFQVIGVPVMAFYYSETSSLGDKVGPNIWLMILVGFFLNAPYALITTAVSADLGTQVKGNDALLALVTGIIDGTGSFGAMIQGVVVGSIQSSSWAAVWHFLMIAQSLSALMISKLVYNDVKVLIQRMRNRRQGQTQVGSS